VALSERDRDFLAAISRGESINDYARRHNYSLDWGVYESRKVRRHYGVKTIREAVEMAEDDAGVSRADFDKLTGLVSKLGESLEELVRRPNDPAAQQQHRERELDVKDHAKALGLSLDDVEKLKGEKEYEKWKAFEDRRLKELEEEEPEPESDSEGNGGGTLDKIRDGLGGLSGVKKA
jgi:DNA-binding transcriptional MerR regulator